MSTECSKSYLQDVVSPEILLLILRLLEPVDKLRLRLTCRRLYAAVSDPAAWPSVSFDYYCTANRKVLDATLSLCSPGVRKVEINTRGMIPKFPWARFTKKISKCASSLNHLSLVGFSPSPTQINTALASFSSLSHLTLELKTLNNLWFPELRSLKSFEVYLPSDTVAYSWCTALEDWSENSFFPRQFCVRGGRVAVYDLTLLLSQIRPSFCEDVSLPLPSDKSAQLQLMYHNGQAFLEVRVEGSRCSIPVAQCSSITSSPLLLVLSPPQSATRIRMDSDESLPKLCVDTPFSCFASTLVRLTLNDCDDVNYESLNVVALYCPMLKALSLDSCTHALENLSGLESISEKCLGLERLSLINIHGHDMNHTLFWNILNSLRKLTYLAVQLCVLPLNSQLPEQKNNTLYSMVVSCCRKHMRCGCKGDLKNMGQLISTNLRVLKLDNSSGDVRDLLCSVPKLQYLHISDGGRMGHPVVEVPTDNVCYQNIEKFYLRAVKTNISCDFIESLVHSGRLTHCFLIVRSISDCSVSKLIRAPRMMCCHIRVCKGIKELRAKFTKAAKVRGIPDFTYAGVSKPILTDADAEFDVLKAELI